MTAPLALIHAAFTASGEKRFWLARIAYPWLFGPSWGYAILAFAYLKIIDNQVDEEPDCARARATVQRQLELIATAYAGAAPISPATAVDGEAFGIAVFEYDKQSGSALRGEIEAVLASMADDVARRGCVWPAARIEGHFDRIGASVFRVLFHFAGSGREVPEGFIRLVSRAYLIADAVIDVDVDLATGIVNLPREDLGECACASAIPATIVRAWLEREAPLALARLNAALRAVSSLPAGALRLTARLYLITKRRGLRRFMQRSRIAARS